jgi:hypothetical protein
MRHWAPRQISSRNTCCALFVIPQPSCSNVCVFGARTRASALVAPPSLRKTGSRSSNTSLASPPNIIGRNVLRYSCVVEQLSSWQLSCRGFQQHNRQQHVGSSFRSDPLLLKARTSKRSRLVLLIPCPFYFFLLQTSVTSRGAAIVPAIYSVSPAAVS